MNIFTFMAGLIAGNMLLLGISVEALVKGVLAAVIALALDRFIVFTTKGRWGPVFKTDW